MKKQLNEIGMVNELRGQSAFFKGTAPQPRLSSENGSAVRPYGSLVRTDGQAVNEMTQRRTKRHPFEIYVDQLMRLQKLKAQALLKGEAFSMSQMVREAIDRYLSEKE